MSMTDRNGACILAINAGSSSLRLALFTGKAGALREMYSAHYEGAPGPTPLRDAIGRAGARIRLVVHRIVHGGRLYRPMPIDAEVEAEIERWAPLVPLHNPRALQWIRASREVLGASILQVAVFDTAYFADLPEVARAYALPEEIRHAHGLRRFGFHGIAHEAMWRSWHALRAVEPGRGGRVITLQLGAGCSVSAILEGRPIDTSMGFTPLEGLLMATRSGDIDPGILIHLQRAGMDADGIENLLMQQSGLAGIGGGDGDMRALLARDDPRARLAVDMFCYRARKYIGAYIAALGGVDGILFGGGIGEHSAEVRRRILEGLEILGIVLDPRLNEAASGHAAPISTASSRVEVRVQPVDEARAMVEGILLEEQRWTKRL
jgi:acetate kinase